MFYLLGGRLGEWERDMPYNKGGVREVTEQIVFAIVGDRMHFTLVSGGCRRTYSITFNKARAAAEIASRMLDVQANTPTNVRLLRGRRGPPVPHG